MVGKQYFSWKFNMPSFSLKNIVACAINKDEFGGFDVLDVFV
jgi:hypothetical protein